MKRLSILIATALVFSPTILGGQSANSVDIAIPATGAFAGSTTGQTDAATVGYAVMHNNSANPMRGMAMFGYRRNNIIVAETSVSASPQIQNGAFYAEVQNPVNTGIAFANPNETDAEISWKTSRGSTGTYTLAARSQVAKFLNEAPFSLREFAGVFEFQSSVPVGVTVLRGLVNERSDFLLTTLPVSDPASISSQELFVPQVALGGGWTTQVILINPTDQLMEGTLEYWSTGTLAVPAVTSSIPYSIPPHSHLRSIPVPGVTLSTRYGRITPVSGSKVPLGVAILSFKSGGITTTETGVAAVSIGTEFRMYAELKGEFGKPGRVATGLAVVNPADIPIDINLELLTLQGTTTGFKATRRLTARSQQSIFIDQVNEFTQRIPPNFRGTLKVASGGAPFALTGLRTRINERGEFLATTIPVIGRDIVLDVASIFPHFVDGGGYLTQFVVMTRDDVAANGSLSFFSPSGNPLPLTLDTAAPLPGYSGSVTDPVGDAPAITGTVPGPDLISARVITQNGFVTFMVRYAPGTYQRITITDIDIDADEDTTTGFPKYDAGQPVDTSISGADFYIEASGAGANILTHTGVPNSRAGVTFLFMQELPDGFDLTVPLSSLFNDDGRFNFKVRSRDWTNQGLVYFDFMPAKGAAPAQVR